MPAIEKRVLFAGHRDPMWVVLFYPDESIGQSSRAGQDGLLGRWPLRDPRPNAPLGGRDGRALSSHHDAVVGAFAFEALLARNSTPTVITSCRTQHRVGPGGCPGASMPADEVTPREQEPLEKRSWATGANIAT